MAWIRTIEDGEATGLAGRILEEARRRAGRVWNIVRLTCLRPRATRASMGLYQEVMLADGPLSRAERELVAVVVSRTNDCFY